MGENEEEKEEEKPRTERDVNEVRPLEFSGSGGVNKHLSVVLFTNVRWSIMN